MSEGSGYNPYRKANGEFASKGEVGDLNEKLASDLVDAQDAGDTKLAAQIENYAMDKLPESSMGKKLLEEKYGDSVTTQRNNENANLGMRELQKAAKDTSDPALLEEIAKRGNPAALKNLARNPNATAEVLETAYMQTDDESARREIAAHHNSDTRIMNSDHVAYAAVSNYKIGKEHKDRSVRAAYIARAEAIAKLDSMDDAVIKDLTKLNADAKTRITSVNSGPAGPLVDIAMSNPNNLISQEAALTYAETSPRAATIALGAGKIGVEKIGGLSPESARFEAVKDPAVLEKAAELSAAGHWDRAESDPWGKEDSYGRAGRDVADRIVSNEHAPSKALENFVGNKRVDQVKLYNHPNLSSKHRKALAASEPSVKSHLRIEKAKAGRSTAELIADVKISGDITSTRTGSHSANVQLDKNKIKAYGLEAEDVERLMGGGSPFYKYDSNTGSYSGSMDSSG